MNKLLMVCFAFVVLSGFVMAAGSEVTTNFYIGDPVIDEAVPVAVPSFWDNYGGQLIAVVVLVGVYFLFKVSSRKKRKKK